MSDENLDSFLHAQAAEDWCPVEYKVVHLEEYSTLEGDGFENFLNALGAQGWDLVDASKEQYMIFSRS
jgi:hypothetical protein